MINKRGAGAGGGTPPAQLGGLGERCKLPQRGLGLRPRRQRFFIISCSKHYIKLRAKTEIVYFFHESNNSEIYMYDYINCWISIGCLKQFSGMCSHADFIHRYSFFIFAVLEKTFKLHRLLHGCIQAKEN